MIPAGFEPVLRELAPLRDRFLAAGHRLYLVGGTVRDLLLDDVAADVDLDLTTPARPAEVKALVRGWADAVWTQGERFGTIGAMTRVIDPRTGEQVERIVEITTHRADSYDGLTRKPTVEFSDRIEADLSRRDFTINAIAVDLGADEPELVDPFDGVADLRAGVLRTPIDPHVSFGDDPLRMVRAARFVARLRLAPVAELVAAVTEMADRLTIVSAERIHVEMMKLMTSIDPSAGLAFLVDTGLGDHVVPELVGLPADERARVITAVTAVPRTAPVVRLAALLVPAGADGAQRRMRAWKASADDIRSVTEIVRATVALLPALDDDAVVTDAAVRALVHRTGDLFDDVVAVAAAHAGAAERSDRRARLDALVELVSARRAAGELDDLGPELDGAAVMELLGLGPGREVGEAIAFLQELRITEGRLGRDAAAARLVAHWATRA